MKNSVQKNISERFLKVESALAIIYELAERNVLDPDDCLDDPGLQQEALQQHLALNVIHDFLINVVYEGRL